MNQKHSVGPHEVEFEHDTGFIVMRQSGELTAEHAKQITAHFVGLGLDDKPTFLLIDNRNATGMTPEARKAFGESKVSRAGQKSYLGIFGGTFAFRVMANLVMTAMKLAGQDFVGTMAADEAAARAWLTKQKAEHGS